MSKLPNFLVIGAPKSGTTSLYFYLKQHPEVYLPEKKELHYFSYDLLRQNVNGPGDRLIIENLCATRERYEEYFRDTMNRKRVGDISPSYLYFSEVSARIASELDDPKIMAILRNPVEKAYSQYMHLVRDNRETLDFREALSAESSRREAGWSNFWMYAESSLYVKRLKEYIRVFGRKNLKIIVFDDFASDPAGTMKEVYRFLDIDDGFVPDTSKTYNRSGHAKSRFVSNFFARDNLIKSMAKKLIPDSIRIPMRLAIMDMNTGTKDPLDEESGKYLKEYFSSDVAELETLLDRKLEWLN